MSFGFKSRQSSECCTTHAPDGIADVQSRECITQGGCKWPKFSVAGKITTRYGVLCVKRTRRYSQGLRQKVGIEVAGGAHRSESGPKTVRYCAQHATDGRIDAKRINCRTKGCGRSASSGVASTTTEEYCAQHTPDGMVHVSSRISRTEG